MKYATYVIMSLGMCLFFSCKKESLMRYERQANIYFDLTAADRDSIVYTFAYDMTKAVDTVFLPVKLMGYRDEKSRSFQAYIEKDSSTAQAEIHYDKLKPDYPLMEGAGQTFLPIIIHNVKDLETRAVSLIIKLQESPDFGIENKDLIRARIILSAQLEQPQWWSMWLDNYSRVKHQLFLLVTEQRTLSMQGLDAPKNLYFANLLLMMLNDPFKWIKDHPEKDYKLESIDGGQTYLFYHVDNPNRTILLRKNTGSGKYFFIDETGKEVR